MPKDVYRDPHDPTVPNRVARKLSSARAAHLKPDPTVRVVGVLKDGSSIVASLQALYVLDDDSVLHRVPWHLIEFAGFDADTNQLKVRLVGSGGHEEFFALDGNVEAVVTAVKERVDASVVHHEQTVLGDGTRVRAALRRDENGELLTQTAVVGGHGSVPTDDPRVVDLVARVRQTVGLPATPQD